MGFKDWILGTEERSLEEPNREALDALVRGYMPEATITRQQALSIPAVSCAIDFITGTLASLPIRLYERTAEGTVEVTDDIRTRLLNDETGAILDAWTTKKAFITDLLIEGEGYLHLTKNGAMPSVLTYIPCNKVSVMTNQKTIGGEISCMVEGQFVDNDELMRVILNTADGIRGRGLIDTQKLLLSTMYHSLQYENRNMRGGRKGFIKSQRRLDQVALDKLRDAWRRLHSSNSEDVIVLNEGIDFVTAQNTATENQLNENKLTNTDLVFMCFGLSRDVLLKEDNMQTAVKTAISPLIKAIEVAINRYFLLENEKGRFFFVFDTYELMKSDNAQRYEAYAQALKNGWLTIDEVRQKENLKELGLDFIKMGLESVLYYPKTGEIYVPNTGESKKSGKGVKSNESRNPSEE